MRKIVGSWLTTALLMCLGAGAVSPQQAAAQVPRLTSPGWDYTDPVNVVEAREYARLWFEFKDTGVVSPELAAFRFTNPAPQGVMTPFYGAELLFEKLYAHRLQAWPDGTPGMYGLTELLRDDPVVEAAFRLYATEGKFTTPLDDATLVVAHLSAIVDAGEAGTEFEFLDGQQIAIVEGGLESTGLLVKEEEGGEPETTAASIGSNTVVEAIENTLPGRPAGNPPYSTPYWPDNEVPCPAGAPDDGLLPDDGFCKSPGHPGFDCDDWARA